MDLQGEHRSGFVYQPALFVVEIAVLSALRSMRRDLGFAARVGAEHTLQIAAMDIMSCLMDELDCSQGLGTGFARPWRRRDPLVAFQRICKQFFKPHCRRTC